MKATFQIGFGSFIQLQRGTFLSTENPEIIILRVDVFLRFTLHIISLIASVLCVLLVPSFVLLALQ